MQRIDQDEYSLEEQLLDSVRKHGGEQAIEKLRAAFGGLRIPIQLPGRLTTGAQLSQCLGFQVAHAVCTDMSVMDADGRYVGNFKVNVALGPNSRTNRIKNEVWRLTRKGMPAQDVAVRLGCSERTVWRRRAEMREQGLLSEAAE